ncbi:MAG: YncE family protein [Niabella sp.]
MRYLFSILFSWFLFSVQAQNHLLLSVWQSDSILATPESVLPYQEKLYISLINGAPWEDDGIGGIGIMKMDGTAYNGNWIKGLSAPKGMGIIGNKLYVADINRVAVIDIKKGEINKTIPIPGSVNLNDITIAKKTVYVSDSKAGRIWQIKKDKPTLYLDDVPRTNGLKYINNELFYGEGKNFRKINKKKNITTIVTLPQEIDGIEQLANGDFIVSSWPGYIYYVYANGKYEIIMETHKMKINTADIGLDKKNNIIFVPTFFDKRILALQVK